LTPRAFGAHRERKVQAVGAAHRLHLPLERLACEPFCLKRLLLRSPGEGMRHIDCLDAHCYNIFVKNDQH